MQPLQRSVPQPTAGATRVYLVDDHPVVRDGFARAIAGEQDIEVVGQADTAAGALAEVVALAPHVVLVDLGLPDKDGVQLLGALRVAVPKAKLVVLSACEEEFRVAEALRAGAHGYLLKTSSLSEIIEGIRRCMAGGAALSARIAGVVVRAVRKPSPSGVAGLDLLTERERQVLRLLVCGHATREVGQRLGISPKTVETHRVRIYTKLGCKSIVELTRFALRSGIIEA